MMQSILGRDITGAVNYSLSPSENKKSATLEINNEETFTVPSTAPFWDVFFSIQPGSSIWVAYGATAEVPAGATFADTTSELNPTIRRLAAGTVVSCITGDVTAHIGISMYAYKS